MSARAARAPASRPKKSPRTPSEQPSLNTLPERCLWIALLLLIALAFSPSLLVQFTLPKLFWLKTLACAIVAAWGVRCWRGELRSIPRSIVIGALAMLVWWSVTTAVAVDPETAIRGMHGRNNGLLTHAICLALFAALASSPLARKDVAALLTGLILSLVPVAVYALAQQAGPDIFVWPSIRPGSTFGHPVPLAATLALATPLAAAFAVTDTEPWRRWLWALAVALFLLATAATLSRGPWAGMAAALAIVAAGAVRWRIVRLSRAWTLGLAAVMTAGVMASSQLPAVKRATARLATITDLRSDPSFMGRFVYIDAGLRMLRERPVTGVGFENYGLLYPRYRAVEGEGIPADAIPSMVHNGYLHMAVTNGLPSLVYYLGFILSIVALIWRKCCRPAVAGDGAGACTSTALIGAAFLGAIAGFLVQDMSGWQEVSLSVYLWTLLGAAVVFCRTGIPARQPGSVFLRRAGGIGAACVALALAIYAAGAFLELRADRHIAAAARADVVTNWGSAEEDLSLALRLVSNHAAYEDAAGLVFGRRAGAARDKVAYDRAAALFDRAADRNRFGPYILIHRIDLDTAALNGKLIATPSPAARLAAQEVVAMDPNNATVHESVARLALAEGRAADAVTAIRRARTLRPRHVRYNLLEGDALRMLGDIPGAVAPYRDECRILEAGTPDWVVAENKLILALLETGQHEAAATEATHVLTRVPSNVITRVLLGFASVKMGAIDAAHDAFAAALAIDSTNTAAHQGMAEVEAQRKPHPSPRPRPR